MVGLGQIVSVQTNESFGDFESGFAVCYSLIKNQILIYACCVFRPAKGCSARRSLVEINFLTLQLFLTLKQLFTVFLDSNIAKNKKIVLLKELYPRLGVTLKSNT